jgi:hypothetical protein
LITTHAHLHSTLQLTNGVTPSEITILGVTWQITGKRNKCYVIGKASPEKLKVAQYFKILVITVGSTNNRNFATTITTAQHT